MRTTKELLTIMSKNKKYFCTGLCRLVNELKILGIINPEESDFLCNYIEQHRPLEGWFVAKSRGALYYWRVGFWFPRKQWLKSQIRSL